MTASEHYRGLSPLLHPPDSVILDEVSVTASTTGQKRRSLLMIVVFTLLSAARPGVAEVRDHSTQAAPLASRGS